MTAARDLLEHNARAHDEVADLYEGDVQYEVKTLAQQVEPILIVGLGGLVLILALGVFLPIWDLGKAAISK